MTNYQQYCWEQYIINNQTEIVAKIIAARERNGLDQEWVAENAGYSLSQYLKFESGERKLDVEDVYRISTVIADYADSLEPPLNILIKKINTQINGHFYRLEAFLLDYFPATEALFNQMSLRKFAEKVFFWLMVILTIFMFRILAYNLGYFVGWGTREIRLFLEALFS